MSNCCERLEQPKEKPMQRTSFLQQATSKKARHFTALVGLGVGLLLPLQMAFADCTTLQKSFQKLSAAWWQWALSVPPGASPMFDTTGDKCMVGQHGSVWFLAGSYVGTVTRTCT